MNRKLLYFIVIVCALAPIAFATARAESPKTLRVVKVDKGPMIDGNAEPIWRQADSVTDFVQNSPFHGKPASHKTVAKVLTTDESLYVLMLCHDDRSHIQRMRGTLDDFSGDVVSFMIDTFNDKRTAYKFAVSASGVRADCRLLDDGRNRDYNWDGVWFSATRIYSWGFEVEMEIPYRSIQYDEHLKGWGLDFDRWIPTLSEDIYWNSYEENEGQRISKFGKLEFGDFYPSIKGLNLEIYPVGIAKTTYVSDSKYNFDPNAGLDVFYNPSQRLTFQLTANPDFAQIEADPFEFNISRYETYYSERRPFFTEGNEVFMPSGAERNSGFYQPLELFYSRRIGKKMPDGSEVPLLLGTRAFGRISEWEYGGFVASTDSRSVTFNGQRYDEERALFGSMRLKRNILNNSSVGLLYVGKSTADQNNGVMDVDGAFRAADWQLAYQLARSYQGSAGDFAMSSGLKIEKKKVFIAMRTRAIGKDFDVDEVGFVPWRGTAEFTAVGGPRWYFENGPVSAILLYTGGVANYERVDRYTDRIGALGLNMQFRKNWGYEVSGDVGRSKDQGITYNSYDINLSSWFSISPKWDANLNGGFSRTYNFTRGYLGYYSWTNSQIEWSVLDALKIGTSFSTFVEWKPDNSLEDVTLNGRPFFSVTPVNNLNVRVYVDGVYDRSSDKVQQLLGGLLFSYNFRPKSWVYLAVNEVRDRGDRFGPGGELLPNALHLVDRASVLKVKYLFYF